MKIILHKLFPYAPYLNEYIGFEKDIPDSSTDEEALQASANLRLLAERSHKERYPEMYESNGNQYPNTDQTIKVVQKEKVDDNMVEMALMDIEKCTEIDGIGGLKSFRWVINQDPRIKEAYDKKLKELQLAEQGLEEYHDTEFHETRTRPIKKKNMPDYPPGYTEVYPEEPVVKTLTITVEFTSGLEMENNLNKAIDELSSVIKRKGLMNMTLEGQQFETLTPMYKVEIQDK